jgi:predicted amidophosphoribosyltransferase
MLSTKDLPIKDQKDHFDYFYYIDYIPLRFKVPEELDAQRKFIWDFRNGLFDANIVAEKLAKDLEYFQLYSPISDWYFCIVPALNQEITDKRFKLCVDLFSKLTYMNNGFDLIRNNHGINTLIYEIDRRACDILHHFLIGDINGKKILLFDDVYNSGSTFSILAKEFMRRGASEVKGLFLGKVFYM